MNIETDIFDLDSDRIIVNLDKCITKDGVFHNWTRERLENILAQFYKGQAVILRSHDGCNLIRSGVYQWIETIQYAFDISDHKIIFNTIKPPLSVKQQKFGLVEKYPWQQVGLKAFLDGADAITNKVIDKRLDTAKFVGALAMGRWSLWRLRLIYELDQAFPTDSFITHNKNNSIFHTNGANDLKTEHQWLEQKTFDVDPDVGANNEGAVDYITAYKYYHHIWNRYQIEVILETDEYQNEWFTDKTAKCLATGKPFVMLSGQNSLQNLRQLGFNTFHKYLDESYDQCRSPSQRIYAIVDSLKTLYADPKKNFQLKQMHEAATENINIYYEYVNSTKSH